MFIKFFKQDKKSTQKNIMIGQGCIEISFSSQAIYHLFILTFSVNLFKPSFNSRFEKTNKS